MNAYIFFISAEPYEMRAAKRRKAKKAAMRRYEEERLAVLEMEAAAAAGSKADDVSDRKSAIQVVFPFDLTFSLFNIENFCQMG